LSSWSWNENKKRCECAYFYIECNSFLDFEIYYCPLTFGDFSDFVLSTDNRGRLFAEPILIFIASSIHIIMASDAEPQSKGHRRGARVAIVPIVNVELYTNLSTAPAIQPHLRPPINPTTASVNSHSSHHPYYSMDVANCGWRHYGNVRGLRRLKWLFEERLGSQIGRRGAWTAVVNCQAVRSDKEVRDVLFGSPSSTTTSSVGFELACHGWDNSTPNNIDGSSLEDEVAYIRRCLLDLEAQRSAYHDEQVQDNSVSSSMTGRLTEHPKVDTWLTPGFKGSIFTADAARMAGVRTLLDFCDDDFPYLYSSDRMQRCISYGRDETNRDTPVATTTSPSDDEQQQQQQQLVCIPYSMETNDFSLVLEMKHDNRQYAQALVDHIRQLVMEAERDEDGEIGCGGGERVVCLGMHTFVAGQPARVNALGDALENLLEEFGEEKMYFATAKEVGNRWRE
jgi:hypothetical protein